MSFLFNWKSNGIKHFSSHLTSFEDYKFHCIKYHSNMRPDVLMFTIRAFGTACQNTVSVLILNSAFQSSQVRRNLRSWSHWPSLRSPVSSRTIISLPDWAGTYLVFIPSHRAQFHYSSSLSPDEFYNDITLTSKGNFLNLEGKRNTNQGKLDFNKMCLVAWVDVLNAGFCFSDSNIQIRLCLLYL